MKYNIHGPLKIPLAKPQRFTREASVRRDFWNELEEQSPGLSYACGCYLISVRNCIWYVGRAEGQDFRHECFTADKIIKIERAMDEGDGPASLTLIARETNAGRFSKPSANGHRDIRDLELLLIGAALERNESLLNRSSTKILREIVVPGFIRSPKGCGNQSSVKAFKRIMGL